jgi:hypothetical protein
LGQGDTLAVKLFADLTPEDGGLPKFEESKNSLLLLPIKRFERLKNKEKYKVVVNNNEACIIANP